MKAEPCWQIPQKLIATSNLYCFFWSEKKITAATVFHKFCHLLEELWDKEKDNLQTIINNKDLEFS